MRGLYRGLGNVGQDEIGRIMGAYFGPKGVSLKGGIEDVTLPNQLRELLVRTKDLDALSDAKYIMKQRYSISDTMELLQDLIARKSMKPDERVMRAIGINHIMMDYRNNTIPDRDPNIRSIMDLDELRKLLIDANDLDVLPAAKTILHTYPYDIKRAIKELQKLTQGKELGVSEATGQPQSKDVVIETQPGTKTAENAQRDVKGSSEKKTRRRSPTIEERMLQFERPEEEKINQ